MIRQEGGWYQPEILLPGWTANDSGMRQEYSGRSRPEAGVFTRIKRSLRGVSTVVNKARRVGGAGRCGEREDILSSPVSAFAQTNLALGVQFGRKGQERSREHALRVVGCWGFGEVALIALGSARIGPEIQLCFGPVFGPRSFVFNNLPALFSLNKRSLIPSRILSGGSVSLSPNSRFAPPLPTTPTRCPLSPRSRRLLLWYSLYC